jgi:hypothetical protein
MKSSFFWYITQCSSVKVKQSFGGIHHPCFQGKKLNQARNQHESGNKEGDTFINLDQWFSNCAPQEVARCAANIMKVYFKNEKKPICIEIYYIHDFYLYSKFKIYITICRIWGFHSGGYEEYHLLGYDAWRWRRYFPPKRRLQLNRLYGLITQKMILFILLYV